MKYPRTISNLSVWPVLIAVLLQIPSSAAYGETAAEGTNQAEADVKACKEQLNRILEALQRYKAQHGRMPNWFLDLHPEIIDDPKTFICPVVQRLGDLRTWRAGIRDEVFWDPILPTSYSYEFCAKELQLAPGVQTTWQEYKKRQMALVGNRVPVVRCFAHDPVLNLPVEGRVYPSGSYWEDEITNVVHEQLVPNALFQDLLKVFLDTPRSFPPRSADADSRLVDLTEHYNFRLDETWVPKGTGRGDFANLAQGVVKLERLEVAFDIRGRVQLKGRKLPMPFPPRVDGIKVNQQCGRLHFLCGTVRGANTTDGTEIGSFEIHYADGQSKRIQIRYGEPVQDWLFDPTVQKGDAQVAWTGSIGSLRASQVGGKLLRLYCLTWENPSPEVPIAKLDFVSALADAAPFLIAITLE
jgi:hypothetical protein